ncbi:MAG TPA: multicopper oxidase domain-containing protein [Castellaniella sp.]|nr:multicopper oxidase domain-containing protein [Castellaniella sp.]
MGTHFPVDERRRSLLLSALSGAAIGMAGTPGPASSGGTHPSGMMPATGGASPVPSHHAPVDLHLQLQVRPGQASILPGTKTRVWRYDGQVLKGDPGAFQTLPGSHLTVLRLRQGQSVRVDIRNELPEDTTVHWHGLHMPTDMDGQPRLPIAPGASFTARFTVLDQPGTYWFHPHAHERVGYQVYHGLAGLLIVEPDGPSGLPEGDHDLPVIIQDRTFDSDQQLVFIPHGIPGRMDSINGFLGDRVLVNGRVDQTLQVASRPYRLRVLNGSNARIYKLAWSDGRPMTVIGTGSGLLPAPIERPYITLAPAERRELWVDLGADPSGQALRLVSQAFDAGTVSSTTGSSGNRLPLGSAFDIMRLQPDSNGDGSPKRPATHGSVPAWQASEAINHERPRRFALEMNVAQFTINGRLMQTGTEVEKDEIVSLNTSEVWEFENITMIPHPMHVHNVQFLVIAREPSSGSASRAGLGWAGLEEGLVDQGWHDTVLVMPGQRVRVLLRFQHFSGLYMLHCHNLEHEDGGMMRYFLIKPS